MVDHLIIFTRYPEPGRTKTRLIPALGPEGAADLQRQLTEHTLRQVRSLQQRRSLRITWCFAGGDDAAMQDWLGSDWDYQPQAAGDLGDRLIAAMSGAFAAGATTVAFIGIDCPGIDAALLDAAFRALETADMVLGPADDGGYYLIGLRRPLPDLFQGIDWGTAVVRQQTEAIAQSLTLSSHLLKPLNDIDRPDDLPLWEAIRRQTISIIIPVLNEAGNIRPLLESLQQTPEAEVIVVDGGSQDGTAAIAQSLGARVITTTSPRARQMNAGAAAATGGILLFLHADTRLPQDFPVALRCTLDAPNVVAGAFDLSIQGERWGLRWVEWGVKWRSRVCQLPYGDQALFLRAETFHALGGFSELPLLEDMDMVRRLKRRGQVAIAPVHVYTSGRRWDKLGILRTTLLNQMILLAYHLGVSPNRLADWYRNQNFPK
ncbi:MAG: TIGR04283 family arsenosugar biosynthesis glycosyltransferase [Cyanobacteria bacterium J06638_22]